MNISGQTKVTSVIELWLCCLLLTFDIFCNISASCWPILINFLCNNIFFQFSSQWWKPLLFISFCLEFVAKTSKEVKNIFTTPDFVCKTSKLNKKWICKQNFFIFAGMWSGKEVDWPHMCPQTATFFKSCASLKMCGGQPFGHFFTITAQKQGVVCGI